MAQPKTLEEIALDKAVKKGDISKVNLLLNSKFEKINDKRYFDYQLIIEALGRSQIGIAKLLIGKGFRVHKKSKVERTILEYAVRLGDIDLVKSILEKGAYPDILISNNQNRTPFHVAIKENQSLITDLFLSQFDAKIFDKNNLLHYAVKQNNIAVVIKMIEKGLSLKKKDKSNRTPFCVAMMVKNSKILEYLLSQHTTVGNINMNNYDDVAPAYIACISGNLRVIKAFVNSGFPINRPLESNEDSWSRLNKYSGFTLLHCAVKYIKLEIVKFLLTKGADILVQIQNGNASPLHIAFENNRRIVLKDLPELEDNNSIIDLLLKANMKLKSNPVNGHGLSHFHVACSRNDPKVVQRFLKCGVNINRQVNSQCQCYKSFTPLHFATKFRCKETLEFLLNSGADVKQTDVEKKTALHIAAMESYSEGVHLLLQYGAELTSRDYDGNTPVHSAFKKQNYTIIDQLLSVHNVAHSNPANSEGLSHFHIACTRSNVDVVKSFIENGVSVETCVPTHDKITDSNYEGVGYSPLHFAVSHNRAKIVELLLRSGANIEIKNSKGFTPLHVTCCYTYEMFGELIKNVLYDLSRNGHLTQQIKPPTNIAEVYEEYFDESNGSIVKINWLPNRKDHFKIINLLLNYESDVNCSDNRGNTPVLFAYGAVSNMQHVLENNLNFSIGLWAQIIKSLSKEVYERRKLILNNLLKLPVDLDKCYEGGSILHYIFLIFDKEADEMFEFFLKNGANVNVTDEMITPLHQAILSTNKKLINLLLDYNANVDSNYPQNNATSLLIATSESVPFSKSVDIIKILVDKGANVNARLSNGRTALHNLASRFFMHNQIASITVTVSLLVKAGANINSKDVSGLTPLHVACLKRNYNILKILLMNGADISIEDNKRRSVPCYLYKNQVKNSDYLVNDTFLRIQDLQKHVNSMQVIGLPISKKAVSSQAKCMDHYQSFQWQDETALVNKCITEVQKLKDKKINANCSLYNVIFKDENTMSKLVKNRKFKLIVQSKLFQQTYPHYGYLIQLKHQAGLHRANLLPTAKCALNSLAGLYLPDVCSEQICSYFTNAELRESLETLSNFVNCNVENSDDKMQLRTRRANKRQKVN